jgi:FKBP-type peptidyl-prolyl cis-trans isomerase
LASTIGYSSSGSSAEGGYEGQYSLDPNVPMILDLEVVRVIKSPSDNELNMVESVVNQSNADNENIWMQIENTEESDTDEEGGDTAEDSSDTEDTEGKEEEKKYYEGIYYTNTFKPMDEEFHHLQYARTDVAGVGNPYKDSGRFANMEEFDAKLWKILNEKFKDQIKKVNEEDAKEIGEENAGMIWYVGRFLDGFIFDTNIDEVKELAFNETDGGGEAISYSLSSNKDEYINAWALGIPKMRYGRWGAIITTSGYAYCSSGVSGSTSTSSASAYNSLANLYNYYSMTGSSYFNSYSYYNYYNYYGGYTNYYDYEDTTTTIDTEIGPYTPLVFYIFVEPME